MIAKCSNPAIKAVYGAIHKALNIGEAEFALWHNGAERIPIDLALPDAGRTISEYVDAMKDAKSGEELAASLALDLTDPREQGKQGRKLFAAVAMRFSADLQIRIRTPGVRGIAEYLSNQGIEPTAAIELHSDVWAFWTLDKPVRWTWRECKEFSRDILRKVLPPTVRAVKEDTPDLWEMRFPAILPHDSFIPAGDPRTYSPEAFKADRPREVKPLQTYSAAELPQMNVMPPPFVVAGLLPAGMTIFAAPPKTGKSWACLDLCASVANGTPFWGHETTKGSVLYLDLEGRAYRLKSRFPQAGIEPPKGLAIAHDAEMLEGGLIEQLAQWCAAAHDPRLIVIDTLARVKPGTGSKLDAYTRDTHILKPLQSFAVDKGLAVVLVTHLNKRGSGDYDGDAYERITGSNAQFGVADTAWTLKGERRTDSTKPSEYEFRATGRDIEDTSIQVLFEKCRWHPIGSTAEVMEQRRKEAFSAHPIINLIVSKVDASIHHEWSATATEIMRDAQLTYGETPPEARNNQQLGHFLRRNAADLFEKCGIIHVPPKRYDAQKSGRVHTFKKKRGLCE